MYKDELKELLEGNKNIKSVWINQDGEWHTSETPDCKEVKRDDILKPAKKPTKDE